MAALSHLHKVLQSLLTNMHSYLYGALGGALIGVSSSVLLLGAGHVMGASGIVSTAVTRDAQAQWKMIFLSSFIITAYVVFQPLYDSTDRTLSSLSPFAFGLGGLLVGIGTKLGNGCTTGHGICGLARLSRRSLVSVCTFMVVGMVTASLAQPLTSPVSFLSFLQEQESSSTPIYDTLGRVVVLVTAIVAFVAPSVVRHDGTSVAKFAPAAISGGLFAFGLFVSRMVYPSVVMGFLNVALIPKGDWDATLAFVMGVGLLVSFASYQWIDSTKVLSFPHKTLSCPVATGGSFSIPSNTTIDRDLVVGAICFGLGWGISGLCPGPALFLASIGVSWVASIYWPAFFLGSFLAGRYKSARAAKNDSSATVEASIKPYEGDTEERVYIRTASKNCYSAI